MQLRCSNRRVRQPPLSETGSEWDNHCTLKQAQSETITACSLKQAQPMKQPLLSETVAEWDNHCSLKQAPVVCHLIRWTCMHLALKLAQLMHLTILHAALACIRPLLLRWLSNHSMSMSTALVTGIMITSASLPTLACALWRRLSLPPRCSWRMRQGLLLR